MQRVAKSERVHTRVYQEISCYKHKPFYFVFYQGDIAS